MRRINGSTLNESPEAESSSRTAGIVRRYVPVDVRDLHGAILRFYVGERYGLMFFPILNACKLV